MDQQTKDRAYNIFREQTTRVNSTWFIAMNPGQESDVAALLKLATDETCLSTSNSHYLIQTTAHWPSNEILYRQLVIKGDSGCYAAANRLTLQPLCKGQLDLTDMGEIIQLLNDVFPMPPEEEE